MFCVKLYYLFLSDKLTTDHQNFGRFTWIFDFALGDEVLGVQAQPLVCSPLMSEHPQGGGTAWP